MSDAILEGIGWIINKTLRSSDIPARLGTKPIAAQYGGEEFVLILPETGLEGARVAAERLRVSVEKAVLPNPDSGTRIPVTVSAGVTQMRSREDDAKDLIRRADEVLYRAKHNGRNRLEIST